MSDRKTVQDSGTLEYVIASRGESRLHNLLHDLLGVLLDAQERAIRFPAMAWLDKKRKEGRYVLDGGRSKYSS